MGGIQLRFGERAGEKLATKGCPLDPATSPHLQLPPCTEVTLGDPPSPLPISLHPRCSQRGPTACRYMEAGALGATHTNQTHGSHTSEWQTQYGDNSWLPPDYGSLLTPHILGALGSAALGKLGRNLAHAQFQPVVSVKEEVWLAAVTGQGPAQRASRGSPQQSRCKPSMGRPWQAGTYLEYSSLGRSRYTMMQMTMKMSAVRK